MPLVREPVPPISGGTRSVRGPFTRDDQGDRIFSASPNDRFSDPKRACGGKGRCLPDRRVSKDEHWTNSV